MVLELGGDLMTAAFLPEDPLGRGTQTTQGVVGHGVSRTGALIEEIVFCMVQKEEGAKES